MFERDLKDLRDSGLLNVKYVRKEKKYYIEEASFDKTVEGPRKAHLLRLFRLGTLIDKLSMTDYYEIETYEIELKEYQEMKKEAKEHPATSPEEREDMLEELREKKDIVDFYADQVNKFDLVREYYELFPESNERTRQRNFKEINSIPSVHLYYDKRLKSHIYYVHDKEDDYT